MCCNLFAIPISHSHFVGFYFCCFFLFYFLVYFFNFVFLSICIFLFCIYIFMFCIFCLYFLFLFFSIFSSTLLLASSHSCLLNLCFQLCGVSWTYDVLELFIYLVITTIVKPFKGVFPLHSIIISPYYSFLFLFFFRRLCITYYEGFL